MRNCLGILLALLLTACTGKLANAHIWGGLGDTLGAFSLPVGVAVIPPDLFMWSFNIIIVFSSSHRTGILSVHGETSAFKSFQDNYQYLLLPDFKSNVSRMRYLAWIAVFSLQIGMFICGAGIDVCHAADTPAQIQASHSNTEPQNMPIDQTCTAHAAHVFLGQLAFYQNQPEIHCESVNLLTSLNLPEILHLIEQPPKILHS